MYGDIFCKVYNEVGWNYYPEAFGEQLLAWIHEMNLTINNSMDLACGTGVLCEILKANGIHSSGMDFSEHMIAVAQSRSNGIPYEVADMVTFKPEQQYDLVTCTGDAINHILSLNDVRRIFENVHSYLASGSYFVFDLLKESEVSDSEPFELAFDEITTVWFQMTRPAADSVNLQIKVYQHGVLTCEENIRETIYAPQTIEFLLYTAGFSEVSYSEHLSNSYQSGTTLFFVAKK